MRAVYNSRRWQRTREIVFARDGYACSFCGSEGPLSIDHDPPLEAVLAEGGNPYDPDGCRALCLRCHGRRDATR